MTLIEWLARVAAEPLDTIDTLSADIAAMELLTRAPSSCARAASMSALSGIVSVIRGKLLESAVAVLVLLSELLSTTPPATMLLDEGPGELLKT